MLNGLVTVASLLKENLELRIVLKRSFSFLAHHSDGGKDDIRSITKGNSVSCSHVLETDYVHALKIRLLGIGSKLIILHELNNEYANSWTALLSRPTTHLKNCNMPFFFKIFKIPSNGQLV